MAAKDINATVNVDTEALQKAVEAMRCAVLAVCELANVISSAAAQSVSNKRITGR